MIFTPHFFLKDLSVFLEKYAYALVNCSYAKTFEHNKFFKFDKKDVKELIAEYDKHIIEASGLISGAKEFERDWFMSLYYYINFILLCESDYLCTNNDDERIYAEKIDTNGITKANIFFNLSDYKLKVTFADNPNSFRNTSPLLDFLESEESDKENKLITVEGKREVGENPIFRYDYILEGDVLALMKMDNTIPQIIKVETTITMIEVFNEKISNIISKYSGMEIEDWEEFISDGIWIPRYTSTK